MLPDTGADEDVGGESASKPPRRRGKARAKLHSESGGEGKQPVARIMQLVAALKAEQDGVVPGAAPGESGERVKLMAWLRRILEAREQERLGWEQQVRQLEAQLAEAQAAAEAARQAVETAAAQHQRIVADLKLMHEHQRSIWQLERRRLEITIDGFERPKRQPLPGWAAGLARPALAAGLLLASLTAVALSADSVPTAARSHLGHSDRASVIVLGARETGSAAR